MLDYPLAIIKYFGGTAGDFLKSLCVSQFTGGRLDLTVQGAVNATNYLKITLEKEKFKRIGIGKYPPIDDIAKFDQVENTHWLPDAMIAQYLSHQSTARLYRITAPDSCVKSIARAFMIKKRLDSVEQWLEIIPQFKSILGSDATVESCQNHFAAGLQQDLDCDRTALPFIPTIDMLHLFDQAICQSIVQDLIRTPLPRVELFKDQHNAYCAYNDWFIESLADNVIHDSHYDGVKFNRFDRKEINQDCVNMRALQTVWLT